MNTINYTLAARYYDESLLEQINYFRSIALDIEEDPASIKSHFHHTAISSLCYDRSSTCIQRTKLLEALSYGDAGVLLACPGPSLSGLMVRELGNDEQKEYFFNYIEHNKAATFLAVTEPTKGSDAAKMQTSLKKVDKENYLIKGEKWLVGHGADAPIGVLVARTSAGPLGITAILLTPDILNQTSEHLYRHHLTTTGLVGARLSRLVFNELKVKDEHILGNHLSPIKRGMMAVMKTFNRMRPGVAAFAIGHAQAVLDYVATNLRLSREETAQLNQLNIELMSARLMLYKAADLVDHDPMENAYASMAKVKATYIAEKVNAFAIQSFGAEYMYHPLLEKWSRDVLGYEYMEGTTNIQLKNIYQGYINGKIAHMSSQVMAYTKQTLVPA